MGSDTREEAGPLDRGVELVDHDMQVARRCAGSHARPQNTHLDVECGGTTATKTKPNFGRRRMEMGFVTDKGT